MSDGASPGWTIPAMEPTDDPDWWRCVDPCDDTCGHPVHAFNVPKGVRHLEQAGFAAACKRSGRMEAPRTEEGKR